MVKNHPQAPVPAVIAALTFESGRVVSLSRPSDAEIEEALDNVRETLRMQIKAHRDRRLAP